jgi:hypothetical protein
MLLTATISFFAASVVCFSIHFYGFIWWGLCICFFFKFLPLFPLSAFISNEEFDTLKKRKIFHLGENCLYWKGCFFKPDLFLWCVFIKEGNLSDNNLTCLNWTGNSPYDSPVERNLGHLVRICQRKVFCTTKKRLFKSSEIWNAVSNDE